jgi:hypothetical protein
LPALVPALDDLAWFRRFAIFTGRGGVDFLVWPVILALKILFGGAVCTVLLSAADRIFAIISLRWLKRNPAAVPAARRIKKIKILRMRRLFKVFELRACFELMGCDSAGNASGGGASSSIFFRAFKMELNFAIL